jgi:hypothetical protein
MTTKRRSARKKLDRRPSESVQKKIHRLFPEEEPYTLDDFACDHDLKIEDYCRGTMRLINGAWGCVYADETQHHRMNAFVLSLFPLALPPEKFTALVTGCHEAGMESLTPVTLKFDPGNTRHVSVVVRILRGKT